MVSCSSVELFLSEDADCCCVQLFITLSRSTQEQQQQDNNHNNNNTANNKQQQQQHHTLNVFLIITGTPIKLFMRQWSICNM